MINDAFWGEGVSYDFEFTTPPCRKESLSEVYSEMSFKGGGLNVGLILLSVKKIKGEGGGHLPRKVWVWEGASFSFALPDPLNMPVLCIKAYRKY